MVITSENIYVIHGEVTQKYIFQFLYFKLPKGEFSNLFLVNTSAVFGVLSFKNFKSQLFLNYKSIFSKSTKN